MKNKFLVIAIGLFFIFETKGVFSRFYQFKTAFQGIKRKMYPRNTFQIKTSSIKKIINKTKIQSLGRIIFTAYTLANQKSKETVNSLLLDYFFPLSQDQKDKNISVVDYDETKLPRSSDLSPAYHYLDNVNTFCKAIYLQDEVIGTISYRRYSRLDSFYLDKINVDQKFQGKGYGKILINYAIQDMISHGAKTIMLTSDDNPVANKLYAKVGFKKNTPDCKGFCRYTLTILKQ